MLVLIGTVLLLLSTHVSYVNMAVTGPEATALDNISELLNPEECHELYIRITIPQKDAKEPREEKDISPSNQWQEISSVAQCKETLKHWLEKERGAVDWDRLARALRQIGRPDVSRELKKSFNKNRSLEPKWNVEGNHTVKTEQSALTIQNKAASPTQRRHHGLTQNHGTVFPKKRSWDLRTSFMQLFPIPWYTVGLKECIGPVTRVLFTGFLTGLVLWLVSVYYVVCWKLGQCLFASGIQYNAPPARQNMSFTMIWNDQICEDSLDDGEEDTEEEVTGDEF